jgi:hypothetical protein
MQIMYFAHPSEGALRAMADGELPLPRHIATLIHLSHCRRCRHALQAVRDEARRAGRLLELLDAPVDTEEAWRRIEARHAIHRPPKRATTGAGGSRLAWAVAALFAIATLTLAADRLHGTSRVLTGGAGHQDICCWDLDGGGRSDDGVMTRSSAGELLDCVVLYDDLDRSRSFTSGDAVRYMSRSESCAPFASGRDDGGRTGGLAMLVRGR